MCSCKHTHAFVYKYPVVHALIESPNLLPISHMLMDLPPLFFCIRPTCTLYESIVWFKYVRLSSCSLNLRGTTSAGSDFCPPVRQTEHPRCSPSRNGRWPQILLCQPTVTQKTKKVTYIKRQERGLPPAICVL